VIITINSQPPESTGSSSERKRGVIVRMATALSTAAAAAAAAAVALVDESRLNLGHLHTAHLLLGRTHLPLTSRTSAPYGPNTSLT